MSRNSRASIASIARYWADAPELSDISHRGSPTVADLRFCLERCADLLGAPDASAALAALLAVLDDKKSGVVLECMGPRIALSELLNTEHASAVLDEARRAAA